ncbi:hypothetical protein Drorol1_Dr00011692 [Drosera rotundifolia]
MDDDDEFGDLYTDIPTPFSSSLTTPSFTSFQPQIVPSQTPTSSITIKLGNQDGGVDGRIKPTSNSKIPSSDHVNLWSQGQIASTQLREQPKGFDLGTEFDSGDGIGGVERDLGTGSRVLGGGDEGGLGIGVVGEVGVGKEGGFGVGEDGDGVIGDFGEDPMMIPGLGGGDLGGGVVDRGVEDEVKNGEFREDTMIPLLGGDDLSRGAVEKRGEDEVKDEGFEEDTMIPGLGGSVLSRGMVGSSGVDVAKGEDSFKRDDEWDSDDSEDDLRIVLNESNPMEMNGMVGIDDDDEDGDPLVIVSDTDAAVHQPAEEQEWGEDVGQVGDGERKEIPEAGKVNAGGIVAPKVAYNNFGYHPFHSQYKYVRPGAAPLPSGPPAAPGGAVGQVHPSTSIGPGRGRGDWRPTGIRAAAPAQKGFQPGYWGSNSLGRGGGLDFTLPSHKTIFEVDIDSFEEKPWKYPGIDLSDYFNFGLNEDTWKEYSKQLEQTRLESTMQSRIRVYERGRNEQGYDPELPPELAAAAGHDSSAVDANAHKTISAPNDLEKGASVAQPTIPIGRAIQVEIGYGERLPSLDTRPPRFRDSDAVIEIVPEGGSAAVDEPSEKRDLDDTKTDQTVDATQEESPRVENQHSDEGRDSYQGSHADGIKKSRAASSVQDGILNEEEVSSSPPESPTDYQDGSRSVSPVNSGKTIGQTKARVREKSPTSSGTGGLHEKSADDQRGESSIRSKAHSIASDDEPASADRISGRKMEEDTLDDKNELLPIRKQKLVSHVEPRSVSVAGDTGNSKGARSSENSKATVSSRDNDKWSDGVDEEVIQDRRAAYSGDVKRHQHEVTQAPRRKEGRVESQRSHSLSKGRDDPYSLRDWDPYVAHHVHAKAEVLDRRRERDYANGSLHRQEDDPRGRRIRDEERREHKRVDETTRHRGQIRDAVRSDKDGQLYSRKPLENGSWRGYDKESGARNQESMEDPHSKRRRDDAHRSRDHMDKEILLDHREISGHRKRERDEQPRDYPYDNRHTSRQKDDSWLQRDRSERPRERDEWSRGKQSYEENLSKRQKDDARGGGQTNQSRSKDDHRGYDKDHLFQDTGRNNKVAKRKERAEIQIDSHYRGNEDVVSHGDQFIQEEKRSRQERSGARSDRAVHASDDQRVHEKKHKESRKARESEGGQTKRRREEKTDRVEMAGSKGTEQAKVQHEDSAHHQHTKDPRDDASSDEEQKNSKRGRSKMERWTSHKDRSLDVNAKSSSSLKAKETTQDNGPVSGIAATASEESARKTDVIDNNPAVGDGKEVASRDTKDTDSKPIEGRHLDTVEKLKKRSERFKLPLPIEKDALTVKKMESQPLPSSQKDSPAIPEVKPERPARRRRWVNS